MPGDPDRYRQRALSCANSAAACTSPADSRKFADLALVWLMLAIQLEEQASEQGEGEPGPRTAALKSSLGSVSAGSVPLALARSRAMAVAGRPRM